jgi:hypothetical protein
VGVREGVAGVKRGNTLGCMAGLISAASPDPPPGLSGDCGAACAAAGVPNASRSKMSADSRQIVPGTHALTMVFEMSSENPLMMSSFG